MKCVDHNYMARASAVFNSSVIASVPIGSFIVSMFISHISVIYMLIGSTAVSIVILVLIVVLQPILEKPEEMTNEALAKKYDDNPNNSFRNFIKFWHAKEDFKPLASDDLGQSAVRSIDNFFCIQTVYCTKGIRGKCL